ncbi:MAG: glycoside hydrolase family 5 protein [Oscillospiraceae bacterium]|nr:glycoside hydrolase family 5 protein [Oscillospiraceae bacterium]
MNNIISAILAVIMTVMMSGCDSSNNGMRDISTMDVVREMGYGINLGNTLESCGDWINGSSPSSYEKAWGSPIITAEDIQGYADAGFGVLRIPVAWSNMMADDGTYTINPDYADRVQEVVDMALGTGMYVIVNIHYDNGWISKFPENVDENMKRYTTMWKQIAELFRDRGDKLVFESQNEALGWESLWNRYSGTNDAEKQSSYDLVNRVNQAFVDTVRATGGNNAKRHLLISGYNTDIDLTCDKLFKMPSDPAGRLAVSVHYYNPSTLTILEKDADWGKAKTDWGSKSDIAELNRCMDLLKATFIDNGIPVIVGEYGCFGKNKTRETKESYMLDVSSAMYEIGACPILWDTSGDEFDRNNARFRNPEFIEKLIAPSKAEKEQ